MGVGVGKDRTQAKFTLSLVVPVFNEAENLVALADCLEQLAHELASENGALEVVVTDNASSDSSWLILSSWRPTLFRLKAYSLAINVGFQASLLFGLRRATGDCVAVLQSDLQDPPELILNFVREWKSGADVVLGKVQDRAERRMNRAPRHAFYWMLSRMSEKTVTGGIQDFYLFDGYLLDTVVSGSDTLQFLRVKVQNISANTATISYSRSPRDRGTSTFSVMSYVGLALDAMLLYGSRVVRLAVAASFGLTCCALLSGFTLVISYAFGWRPAVAGWMSLALLVLVMASALGLVTSLALEYLIRIYRLVVAPDSPVVVAEAFQVFDESS